MTENSPEGSRPGRDAILVAARRQFAERGYAATSMSAIAKSAGTSQALIHHHFGTKRRLFDEVLASLDTLYREHVEEAMSREGGSGVLGALVKERIHYLISHPEIMRIWSWCNLQMEGQTFVDPAAERLFELASSFVKRAQSRGDIRGDIDSGLLLVALSSMIKGYVQVRESLWPAIGYPSSSPELDDAFTSAAIRLLMPTPDPATRPDLSPIQLPATPEQGDTE